jgi:hypothetical protein
MIYAIAFLMICDSPLAALFTPPHPRVGRYEVCTTADPIERAAGAGDVEDMNALDGFGAAGPYDRAALARLYGGRRVRVARRWEQHSETFVALTYLSPYPDAALTHLTEGTLVIRWTTTRGL